MRKFRIPYIPYRSLLLSTTVLNDDQQKISTKILSDLPSAKYMSLIISAYTSYYVTIVYSMCLPELRE